MNTDGIIFDVDGTLWDCTEVVAARWSRLFAGEPDLNGLSLTGADLRKLFGKPLAEIGAILFHGLPDERQAELLEKCYIEENLALEQNPPAPYEGVETVFRELSGQYPLFIVSNCQSGYIEQFLKSTGFAPYITDHLCPGDTGLLKADNIRLIAERHHLTSAVYVGDTALDCDSSREAGVSFVFASYGFGQAENPDAVIAKPLDLLELFPVRLR